MPGFTRYLPSPKASIPNMFNPTNEFKRASKRRLQ